MRYMVKEAFKTHLRRFAADVEIDESELDGPLSAADLVRMKKIEQVAAPARSDDGAAAVAEEVAHIAEEHHVSEADVMAEVEHDAAHR